MTSLPIPFARLPLLLPWSCGDLPAVIVPPPGDDGRTFSSFPVLTPEGWVGMPRQPVGECSVGGNKPRGRSINAHLENSKANAGTLNLVAAAVIGNVRAVFPSHDCGVRPCAR